MSNPNPKFRTVNRILGAQPNLGPIPADQVMPWTIIIFLSWFIGNGLFKLDIMRVGLIAAWLMGTWWILTGNRSWRFLAKFISAPTVTRGYARYRSLLEPQPTHERETRQKKARRRKRQHSSAKTV